MIVHVLYKNTFTF